MKTLFYVGMVYVFVCLLQGCSESDKSTKKVTEKQQPLICHVGGTMRPVTEELAKVFKKQTGIDVEINSAGSGELLAQIESNKVGDVYICHDPFLDVLMRKNLGKNGWTVGELTPIIAVQKGNPKKIKDLKDLTKPDVELILTDYQHSTLGRMLPVIFAKADIDFQKLNEDKKITVNRSGSYAANYVKMKNADATMVWRAVAILRKDALDIIEINKCLPVPGVDAITSATGKSYFLTPVRVTVATLKCSMQSDAAEKFAEFVASGKAQKILEKFGFTINKNIIRQNYKDAKKLN